MTTDRERYRKARELFDAAAILPEADRRRFLDAATKDADLKREVLDLLTEDAQTIDSFGTVVRGDVYALADQTLDDIFVGQLTVFFIPLGSRTVSIAGARPWDGAPGGRRNSLQQMYEVVAPYGDIIANYPNHCFIPTISALDIATGDPFYDVAGDVDLLAHVPFDAVYFPSENQDHVAVTPESKLWFLDEITPLATPAPPARAAAALRLDAHPNPFNPSTAIDRGSGKCSATALKRSTSSATPSPVRIFTSRKPASR